MRKTQYYCAHIRTIFPLILSVLVTFLALCAGLHIIFPHYPLLHKTLISGSSAISGGFLIWISSRMYLNIKLRMLLCPPQKEELK